MGVFDRVLADARAGRQAMDLGTGALLVGLGWGVFLVLHGYLIHRHGQTIGKRVLGTRMVDERGRIAGFGKVVGLRYFLVWFVESLPVVGGVFALVDVLLIFRRNHRCLHDDIAGTYVVNA